MAISDPTTVPGLALDDPALYVNREISWLEFNARVLAIAADPGVPLLDRCKFMAIFSTNLDEFFMVRVAGVQDALAEGRPSSAPDQVPREEALERIRERVCELVDQQSDLWRLDIQPALVEAGIPIVAHDDLSPAARDELRLRFEREVYPALTPLAVGPALPFPYISGLSLNLGMIVREPVSGETRFARVKVPPRISRFVETDEGSVLLEELIERNLDRVFPGMEIDQVAQFRITRDADFTVHMDDAEDLMGAVEDQLRRRRFGHAVRLEVRTGAPDDLVDDLREAHELRPRDIYPVDAPLDLGVLWELADLDRPDLRGRPWKPQTPPRLRADGGDERDIFAVIRAGDLLVHHPYDDFGASVQCFIERAADDPDVLAIKQTVYRTTSDSPIIAALMRAAEQGKQTVCLVELQARFDEERNIRQARLLERAGVHVVYGEAGRKTHAKLCLVVRREGDVVRRYVHVGTGNYNPQTARLYTDLGLFTCSDDIGEDVADVFNYLTGFGRPPRYRKILVAPDHVRAGLLGEVDRVVEAHLGGVPGRVIMKVNAAIDGPVIEALFRASQAGVRVDLIVRSISGLIPGIPGVSENMRVVSIVGDFLEHSRIFAFISGEDSRYYLGSADLMARNLDNRVEVVAPVEDPTAKRELQEILDLMLADTALAWEQRPDGGWRKLAPDPGEPPLNCQAALMERALARPDDAGATEGAIS